MSDWAMSPQRPLWFQRKTDPRKSTAARQAQTKTAAPPSSEIPSWFTHPRSAEDSVTEREDAALQARTATPQPSERPAWFGRATQSPVLPVQRAADPALEAEDEALAAARLIYADMNRQFKRWKQWGGTLDTRGAWWGAAWPGSAEGAQRVPGNVIAKLRQLTEKSSWVFGNSDSGGISFKRKWAQSDHTFIYHMAPP